MNIVSLLFQNIEAESGKSHEAEKDSSDSDIAQSPCLRVYFNLDKKRANISITFAMITAEIQRGCISVFFRSRWITATILFTLVPLTYAIVWIYQVDPSICNGCGNCIPYCTTGALYMDGPDAVIDPDLCNGCGNCAPHCIRGAIYKYWYEGLSGDEPEEQLLFGPNPSSGLVLLTGATVGNPVEVFDIYGRLVVSTTVSFDGEALIDLSDLASGNYRIRVGSNEFRILALVK